MIDGEATTIVLEHETRRIRRGSMLSGRIRISSERIEGRKLVVSWYTEGKGDRDETIVHEVDLAELPRRPASDGTVDLSFRLRLPLWPITYHGELIKIHWQVSVQHPGSEWHDVGEDEAFEVVL